jgi:thioredoxin-like negative regulator of GroEL
MSGAMIQTRTQFQHAIEHNTGIVIFRLVSPWCKFCNGTRAMWDNFVQQVANCSADVTCHEIDIDASPDVYAYLRSKRIITGIPCALAWYRGNHTIGPDESCTSGRPQDMTAFFNKMAYAMRS